MLSKSCAVDFLASGVGAGWVEGSLVERCV